MKYFLYCNYKQFNFAKKTMKFKVWDKVFDNVRGYGEGVVIEDCNDGLIKAEFKGTWWYYTNDGRWKGREPITLFKQEQMKNYFYVGQKVSHQAYGDGVIACIGDTKELYPIVVDFEYGCKSFTLEGKLYSDDKFISLSQKPHKEIYLEEVFSFEKGELVWVLFHSGIWDARYYSHSDKNGHYCFINQKKDGVTNLAKSVRKFSDNPLN